jgi:hypothetical protein
MGDLDSRYIIIYDNFVSQNIIEQEEKSTCHPRRPEVVPISILNDFSGEKASNVIYLCGNPNALLNESDALSIIVERILKPSGQFELKCGDGLTQEIASKLGQHLKWNGFVTVTMTNNSIKAEKDKFEVYRLIVILLYYYGFKYT